jgi:putative membrane protein
VSSGTDEVVASLTNSKDSSGQTTIYGAAQQLASGASSLSSGAAQVSSGSSSLASGLDTLSSGTNEASSGSKTLSSSLEELHDSVSGLDDKVLDQLQSTIDEKLGKGYALHSFVDPSNTDVSEVEFAYVVDGIKNTDDDTSEDSEDQSEQAATDTSDSSSDEGQNFFTRLAALFSSDKSDK